MAILSMDGLYLNNGDPSYKPHFFHWLGVQVHIRHNSWHMSTSSISLDFLQENRNEESGLSSDFITRKEVGHGTTIKQT